MQTIGFEDHVKMMFRPRDRQSMQFAFDLWSYEDGPESSPLRPTIPRRRTSAIAARAGLLLLHHQIERDLHEVSQHIPTVVVPSGIEAWPAPWDFGHSQRLISTASVTAGRFLDELRISGPGLYRVDDPPATSVVPGEASAHFISGVDL